MKNLTCPNSPDHKLFHVTAHVTEEWVVDSHGDFVTVAPDQSREVVHRPTQGDLFTCTECGEEA